MHLPSFLSLLGVSLRLPCVPFRGDLSHFSHRRKQQQRPRHKSVPSVHRYRCTRTPARTWRRSQKHRGAGGASSFPRLSLSLFDDP